jgi:LL-diaminopimelate aminotransferase
MTTAFNGASNIVQSGGLNCLDDEGLKEIDNLIDYYLGNAKILRSTFEELGFNVYGGTDAPYIFVQTKNGQGSWDAFSEILEKIQVVTIPGAGFGPGGEGFLRMSAFAPRSACEEACKRFRSFYHK